MGRWAKGGGHEEAGILGGGLEGHKMCWGLEVTARTSCQVSSDWGQSATFTVRRKGRNLRKVRWLTADVQEHLWNSSLEREVRCATWQAWGPEPTGHWRGKSRSKRPSQLPACQSQQVQIRAAAGPSDRISFPTSSAPKGLHLPCPAHAKTQVLCLKSLPALILHLPPG